MGALMEGIKSPVRNLRQIRGLTRLEDEGDSINWALRDVSFEVKEGEVLGIIGHNGAGKSTLLKILSRITEPSAGEVCIHGRVAALLEVGTGFHPELTGRENIYMNGTILGMRKKEIDRKLNEIVDFSGVEKYLDTPVKFYSSGMRVRLGFSVAAHLEPEILIIDEVLAVGDAEFQRKCLGKMENVAKQGRTVLFVSHNLDAVKNLCTKSLLLQHGVVKSFTETPTVINDYLSSAANTQQQIVEWEGEDGPGNEYVRLVHVKVICESAIINVHTPFTVSIRFWNYVPQLKGSISLHVKSITGETVCNVFSELNPVPVLNAGLCEARCQVPGDFLNTGFYYIQFYIVRDKSVALFEMNNILSIEVLDDRTNMDWYGRIPGLTRPKFDFKVVNV